MAFSDYSATPGSNTSIAGINIAENCSPANINNAIRQLMADAKTFDSAAVTAASVAAAYQPLDASLTAHAALVTAADKAVYYTAADTPATFDLTAFARTLLDDANAAAALTTLGALGVTAVSLANPGYIHLSNGLKLQWGTGTLVANTAGSISYPISFTTFGVCIVSGGPTGTSSEGDVHPTAASGLSSQAIVNSGNAGGFYSFIAIGV